MKAFIRSGRELEEIGRVKTCKDKLGYTIPEA